jgi:3-(methylthio)propanoyl-CoA dehydrogenase
MYSAPIKDLRFVLGELLDDGSLAQWPAFAEYSADLRDSILEEAGRFASSVLDPLYRPGDVAGAKWTPQGVQTPAGFKEAYRKYVESGWPALRGDGSYGGQNLPSTLVTGVEEMWSSANLAFKLCPMLTQGASEAIDHAGTAAQKQLYLPKMIAGEWSGTMNLTEPQAGSDLSMIRTRATREGDHYHVFGQKIFITYGDQDLTSNVIHLVLARVDGAPAGTRGISLFIVPKYLVNADGSLGARNDVECLSIEHKLGIHASPTCVMAYGQKGGAIGYLVGEENRGLEYMFVMMNAARLSVGVEGYAVAERAYQQAANWARTRVQGRPAAPGAAAGPQPIINHPDVKRMLLQMRSQTEAMRALALHAAHELDTAAHHPDPARRHAAQSRGDLLIPIVKGCSTEIGQEVASVGIQVHGGMGFIEETGAAQALRDVRICTIYEGTTGIQAADLAGRKFARDGGAALGALVADMQEQLADIKSDDATVRAVRQSALDAVAVLADAAKSLGVLMAKGPEQGLAVSVPFLRLCGVVCGGWLMARAADVAARRLAAGGDDRDFLASKLQTARFYAAQILPRAQELRAVVTAGSACVSEADAALI